MNLPYLQSEIFRELVNMEPLLKPEYYLKIIRHTKDIEVRACRRKRNFLISVMMINTSNIKTWQDITAEINRIWQAIPAECKRITLNKP